MRLFLLDENFTGNEFLTLEGKNFRYLTKVLRLKKGQKITGRDKIGNLFLLELKEVFKDSCVLKATAIEKPVETTDNLPKNSKPLPSIYLFQAITKQKKFEQIIRQSTELGVKAIIPVNSKFSTKEKMREERCQSMIKEAIQQSGSLVPTTLEKAISIIDIPTYWKDRGPLLFFHQNPLENQENLSSILSTKNTYEHLGLLIGSEGGFNEEECNFLRKSGFHQLLLQTNILRAETAAICACSICQFLLTESKSN